MKMRVTLPHRDPGHLAGLALEGKAPEPSPIDRLGGRLKMRAQPRGPRADPSSLRVRISASPKPKPAAMPAVDMGANFRAQLAEAERRRTEAGRQQAAASADHRAADAAASWGRTFDRLGWPTAGKST